MKPIGEPTILSFSSIFPCRITHSFTIENSDRLAIGAVKSALTRPKTLSFRFIECEFPPLQALNKLGDGSRRSMAEVDSANLRFCGKLIASIALFGIGPRTWLLTSSTSTQNLNAQAAKVGKVWSLKQGLPSTTKSDVCILVAPSVRADYQYAKQLAQTGTAVVIVNALAKEPSSIESSATMAYYLKPLTYNSQVAGYLTRVYPGPWTTLDTNNRVLLSVEDRDILVPGSNTPDFAGLVQSSGQGRRRTSHPSATRLMRDTAGGDL